MNAEIAVRGDTHRLIDLAHRAARATAAVVLALQKNSVRHCACQRTVLVRRTGASSPRCQPKIEPFLKTFEALSQPPKTG
jgi:hypothetical protein